MWTLRKYFIQLPEQQWTFFDPKWRTAELREGWRMDDGGEGKVIRLWTYGGERGRRWYPACYLFWQASSCFFFLAQRSERVRVLWAIRPLTPASCVLLCLPLTSPALPRQLRQVLVVSHPVVLHRHRDGPEPAWRNEAQGALILHLCCSCRLQKMHTSPVCTPANRYITIR